MSVQIPKMTIPYQLQNLDWTTQTKGHNSGVGEVIKLYQQLPDKAKDFIWNKVKGWGEVLAEDSGVQPVTSQDEIGRGMYLGQNEADVAPQTWDYIDSMEEATNNAEQARRAKAGEATSATGGQAAQDAFAKALAEAKKKFGQEEETVIVEEGV